MRGRPEQGEFAPYYNTYIRLVPGDDVVSHLSAQLAETLPLLRSISEDKSLYRYAEGKWSIRQIIGHLIDGERVFGYRALCIARGETQNLPGFDENEYMPNAPYENVELEDLLSEFRLVRLSNIAMMRNFDDDAWTRVGTANGTPVTVRALAFIMVGHVRHHMGVLRERYQVAAGS